MVLAKDCEKIIIECLNNFFANRKVGIMKVHSEAYFANIERQIIEALNKSQASIDICVAWFTNDKLKDKLLERQKDGVKVRVITFKDGVNHKNRVDFTGLDHKEFRGERHGILHDKFCIIDNATTISGSYNWTLNAENKNDEDAQFVEMDVKNASKYTRRFNEIWNRS
jgi:phosphatidylserine/phosphatidylglycerophosphate/cardiolipin synthase-like enzyme